MGAPKRHTLSEMQQIEKEFEELPRQTLDSLIKIHKLKYPANFDDKTYQNSLNVYERELAIDTCNKFKKQVLEYANDIISVKEANKQVSKRLKKNAKMI